MAEHDEYRELVQAAERAVHDLLVASEPDAWLSLRSGYGELRREARRHNEVTISVTRMDHVDQERRERDAINGRWGELSAEMRENLLWQVLGDERLLIREIVDRLNDELVPENVTWRAVYENTVRGMTTRLMRGGQLDRVAEPWRGRVRYRYFRHRGLSGPIAELERAFHEDDLDEPAR